MGFFVAFFVSLAMMVVGELLRPKQKPPNAKASGLDDFDMPTAEEGRSVPVFCGKVKISGPNVVAYGDLESRPLTRKVKTGLFSSKRQTYAHRYYLGMHMVLGHGSDGVQVHEVLFGDAKPMYSTTNEGNGCFRLNFMDENFYGGDEKEGGVEGVMRFYTGSDFQTPNSYLANITTGDVQAYAGLCHAVLEKMYIGTSQYIKPVGFIVSRYPNGLGVLSAKHMIGEDANPVCFIFEVLTNPLWGVGLQPSDIDQVMFRAVAETVHSEGYGVSLVYNGGSAAKDVISDILRHIDGIIFSDPETGLISIRVARKDYDVGSIPVYGPDDFLGGINFSRPSWSGTKNTVKSTYVDRDALYTTAIVSQQDLANVMQRGGEVAVEELDFSGFSTYAPAALATARALKTLSYPLARISGALDRRAWKTKPGDVFILNWPDLGVESAVFRVNSVRYGGLDQNDIGIEAVEDIFAISDIAYVQPPPSGWVDPLAPPEPMLLEYATDMPYPLEPVEGSTVAAFGYRSSGTEEGYAVVSDRKTPFETFEERSRESAFTSFAVVASALPLTVNAVEPSGVSIINLRGVIETEDQDVALVVSEAGEEWIAYRGRLLGALQEVWRGVFDTPPLDHPAGALIIFPSAGYAVENAGSAYTEETEVHVKLLPYNARGMLDPDDAEELTVETRQRGSRPFPPGKVRVNGVHPLAASSVAGSVPLSWASRNRHHPALTTQDDDSVAPEPGTTYNVRAYDNSTDTLLAEGSGNLPTATMLLDFVGDVRVEIESEVGGLESLRPQVFVLDYDGTGASGTFVEVDSAEYILDGGGA